LKEANNRKEVDVNVCKYWIENEPVQCPHWDQASTICKYKLKGDGDNFPDRHPYCNLIGTSFNCNKYGGQDGQVEARCVLPDPFRGGKNILTGKYWVVLKKGKWGFSAITAYGEKGLCDSKKEIKCDKTNYGKIGKGNGLSVQCTGYSPGNLTLGPYLTEKAFDLSVVNSRAICSKCRWWDGDAVELKFIKKEEINEDSGDIVITYVIEAIESLCTCKDESVKQYKDGFLDKDTHIRSLKCNGAKSECPFYTGVVWQHCIDGKMKPGDNILAEQVQELRYYMKGSRWSQDLLNLYFAEITDNENYDSGIYSWDGNKKQVIIVSEGEIVDYDISTTKVELGNSDYSKAGLDAFNIKYTTVHLVPNKTTEQEITYPTLIEDINLHFGPVILNKFDKKDKNNNENGSGGEDVQNIFETTEIDHEFIDIIGECKFYESMPFAINMSILKESDFPRELLDYSCMIEIEKEFGKKKYIEFYTKLSDLLEMYFYYKIDEVYLPSIQDRGGAFIIPVKTKWKNNDIFVFDKGSGRWEYDKISVNKIFYGAVIAQTEFNVSTNINRTIDYLPFYKASFCGEENKESEENTNSIKFELKSYGHEEVEGVHVYNDYVIANEYDDKKYEAGYEVYKKTIVSNHKIKYDDGKIIPIGTGGILLLIFDSEELQEVIHNLYGGFIINDEENIDDLELEINVKQKGKDDKIYDKIFKVKVLRQGLTSMLSNQILVKPKNDDFCGVGPDTSIEIESIKVYEKLSFGQEPEDDDCYEKSDYMKTGMDTKFSQENDVTYNKSIQLKNINTNKWELNYFSEQTMLMSVVYKSKITNKILGVVRTKMITWVRQPSCRDVQVQYTWNAEYEEFDMVPLQYFRLEQIGFLEDPAQDSNIKVSQTIGYGDFMGYPYTFFPSKAIYPMDPDVLQAADLFYPATIEYYREEQPGEVEVSYRKNGQYELTKVIKQKPAEKLKLKASDVQHGYFDMRRLCPAEHNVTIWLKIHIGGYISFCLTNTLPANLDMLSPPEFDGSAMVLAGLSAGLYGHHQQELGMGISEGKSPFNVEQCIGRFGGGTREVMESYRSIDNLCYGAKGDKVKAEKFKDLIAFEKLKTGSNSKIELKKQEESSIQDIQLRQWLPTFDTFSNWGLTNNLTKDVFESYTFDLESSYYHPFSIFLCGSIDSIQIKEKIEVGDYPITDVFGIEKIYKRFTFNEVFDTHKFEDEFPGFKYAVGTMYPNLAVTTSGGDYNIPNNIWLTFKELEDSQKQIQWAWQDKFIEPYRKPISDYKSVYTKELYTTFKEDINIEPVLSPPFFVVDDKNKGRFLFFEYTYPEYIYDGGFNEHRLVCDEGNHEIKILVTEESIEAGVIFIQLNDGPPRGLDKDGNFDPEIMKEFNTEVGGENPNDLYKQYTTYTKAPWKEITLFDTDYGIEDDEEQAAKDDGRYFKLYGEDVFYKRGLDLKIDFETKKKWLPSEEMLIKSNVYEYLFTEVPDPTLTKSDYASVEINEWYPNEDFCYNVVYDSETVSTFSLKFRFDEDDFVHITKMVFVFDYGLEIGKTGEFKSSSGKKIRKKHLYLYNIPTIEIITTGKDGSNSKILGKNIDMDVATIKDSQDVENKNVVFKHFIDLLDKDEKIEQVQINFRLKPTDEELEILELEENNEEGGSGAVDKLKYIIHHLMKLNCVYMYHSKIVEASEDITTYERKFLVSTGQKGDFYPNKFEIPPIEEAYLKYNNNHERIISLSQVDSFDGMIGYSDSGGVCTSMSKCRGRLMGEVQREEMEGFDGGDVSSYENKQEIIYNKAVDKGSTVFSMKSTAPPVLKEILNKMELSFPTWACSFKNDTVLKLTPLLKVDPIIPPGYYFDWGLDNIIKRSCFALFQSQGNNSGKITGGRMSSSTVDCFDGYKLKSYYDEGAIIGSITDEVFASNSYRATRISVQDRERQDRDSGDKLTGWNANRLAGGLSVDTQESTRRSQSAILQQEQLKEKKDMRDEHEKNEKELIAGFEEVLTERENDYYTQLSEFGEVAGYPEKEKERIEMIDKYYDKKRETLLKNNTELYKLKDTQRIEYYELLTRLSREAEESYANKEKITVMSSGLRDKELEFLKNLEKEKDEFDKGQAIDVIEFDIENNRKIDKELNVRERQNLIVTYKEDEESFEEDQLDELEQFEEDQEYEKESFYKNFYPTEHVKMIYIDLYGGSLILDEGYEVLDTTDINAKVSSTQEELEEYGKGTLFEIQREAFFLLNAETLTKSIWPHPILAYYMPDLQ